MEQRAVADRRREIERPAAIREEIDLRRAQPPVIVVPDGKLRVERMPLAGDCHVHVATELEPHRPSGPAGRQRHNRRARVGLRLLAAEGAAHPRRVHDHLVARQPEHLAHDRLNLRRCRRGMDRDGVLPPGSAHAACVSR